jgi:hypothetical protein
MATAGDPRTAEARAPEPSRRHPRSTALAVAALLAVAYAGICKGLLFRNLEYVGSDLFSFLEMSWSWYYAGLWLHDNIFDRVYALHNFFLVPAFSVLTIPFGAYGLVAGLALLNGLAAWRVATVAVLDLPGRLAVLGGLFSPIAFFAFDNPYWGFHPELCYPPLSVLFATELASGSRGRALAAGLAVGLVKEDGAVLCACVLLAWFASRLWDARRAPREARRRLLVTAVLVLASVTVVFVLGMALLASASRTFAATQFTSTPRVSESVRILLLTIAGRGGTVRRLVFQDGLVLYALMAALLLLPLARRLARGLALVLLSAPPILFVLLVSSAGYYFSLMLWAPRVATLLASFLACLVFASADAARGQPGKSRGPSPVVLASALVALSWALQLTLLEHVNYSPWWRLDLPQLLGGKGYAISGQPPEEVRFLRCLAARLPGGLPLSAPEPVRPFFHRQSMVLDLFIAHAWHPARFRVVPIAESGARRAETPCPGPRAGGLAVQAECALLPLVASCGDEGAAAR